ncbi:MAG: outer membrane protein assembly factor BamE [Pseudomonadota bacterium]
MKAVVALISLIVIAGGCSKLTMENYAKLKMGMTYSEVTALLGSPVSCDDVAGFKSCQWGDDKRHVSVQFAGDKTVLYSAENLK